MMTIASAYEMQPPGQKDLAKAIAHAASSMPPCKAYIKSIGDFVGKFAGGESFKLLKYLDFIGSLAAICLSFHVSRFSWHSKVRKAHFKKNSFTSWCKLMLSHAGSFQKEFNPQLVQAHASHSRLISERIESSAGIQAHASHSRLFAMTDSHTHTHFPLATVYDIFCRSLIWS